MFSSQGHIPTQTSTALPTAGYVGLCLCLWWIDFLGGCPCSVKEILNHSALFWDNKKTFFSLVNHNLSLLSWCKPDLQSIDSGHGFTFEVNTSFIRVTKAYTSYLKNKRKKAPWPAREDRPLVMLNNSTKSGMNISGWPRKGSINYSHHYMLGTKRTKGRVWSPSIRPKRTKIYGVPIHQTM